MDKVIDRFFTGEKSNVTMGIEVEMYLYDAENENLLDSNQESTDILNQCLGELPETVTKDYYNYQLEVRTKPHNNPEDVIKEFVNTLLLCRKVFAKHNIEIKPLSWLGGQENFNGLHIHFRNGTRTTYQNSMFNMYPFVLALTDCFKNSIESSNSLSRRIKGSHHLAFPELNDLAKKLVGEHRYRDIIVNGYIDNNRHRLKDKATIEIRTFDIPNDIDYFKNLIRLMFNTFKYINSSSEVKLYSENENKSRLLMTRDDICYQRTGHNFYLNCSNRDIYEYLCDKFKIEKLQTPVTLIDKHPIQNSNDLARIWRKLGTKAWLKEEIKNNKNKSKTSTTPVTSPYNSMNTNSIQLVEDLSEELDEEIEQEYDAIQ